MNETDLLRKEKEELEKRLERAYSERNRAVILAAQLASRCVGVQSGWYVDKEKDWDREWCTVVHIEKLGGEQVSWHMDPVSKELAEYYLPPKNFKWDGTYLSRDEKMLGIFD